MKAFFNNGHNRFVLTFPNGNSVSTIWTKASYSDNKINFGDKPFKITDLIDNFEESNTVEIAVDCSAATLKEIEKYYGGKGNRYRIFGYLSITEWLAVINIVAQAKKRKIKKHVTGRIQ